MSNFHKLSDNVQKIVYDMGWESLREIQEQAIESIMETDKHVVISANTASGKTEAAFLPILSMVEEIEGCSVLYIAPLKTLLNNQYERLIDLTRYTDFTVTKWHGDVSQTVKANFRKNPSTILQITPESFETILMNYTNMIPKLFGNLQFIVIDEFHYFAESVRGYQLRSQIQRLNHYLTYEPRMVLLSATIYINDEVRSWIDKDHSKIDVLSVKEERTNLFVSYYDFYALIDDTLKGLRYEDVKGKILSFELERAAEKLSEEQENEKEEEFKKEADLMNYQDFKSFYDDLYDLTKEMKSIIFFNNKSNLEIMTYNLNKLAKEKKYLIHHGSLNKDIREHVEKEMMTNEHKNVTATSTLELGVDIGDVDSVVQVTDANTVSSLKQRVGRAGRKGQNAYFQQYTISGLDRQLYSMALIELLKTDFVEEIKFIEKPYHILFHQTLALLKERNGMTLEDYLNFIENSIIFNKISKSELKSFLMNLETKKFIQILNDEMILYVNGERITGNFEFYSVFGTTLAYNVFNIENRQLIGEIVPENLKPSRDGKTYFLLNGMGWEVIEFEHDTRKIICRPSKKKDKLVFHNPLVKNKHPKVVEKMLSLLNEYRENSFAFEQKYSYINDNVLLYLKKESEDFVEIENDEKIKIIEDTTHYYIHSFLSTQTNNLLVKLLEVFNFHVIPMYEKYGNQIFSISKDSDISLEEFFNVVIKEDFAYEEIDVNVLETVEFNPNLFKFFEFLTKTQKVYLLNQHLYDLKDWHKHKNLILEAYKNRLSINENY